MKLPGPDHPITITANPKRIRVSAGGVVIADTTHALTLKEASYPAVQYVPRQDANMALLARTDRVTHCPYKGDASYFSIKADGKTLENAIWTYETPFPAMTEIAGPSGVLSRQGQDRGSGLRPRRKPRDRISRGRLRAARWRARMALYPEDREPEDQQHQEDHDEDIEQEAGDIRRCRRYAGEAEDAGDDRHQEEDQRPFQNCHGGFLQPARATAAGGASRNRLI